MKNVRMLAKAIVMMLVIVSTSSAVFATDVVESTAKTVAINFLSTNDIVVKNDAKSSEISLAYVKENAYFVYNYNKASKEEGFVIVAATDLAIPILGYDTMANFVPPQAGDTSYAKNIFGLLNNYEQEINYVRENNILASAEVEFKWQSLLSGEIASQARNDKSVTTVVNPLLTTEWGQGAFFNDMCPVDASGPNGHVWAGCDAVTLAQILKFIYGLETDFSGNSQHGYTWGSYPNTFVNFGNHTYDFAAMPNSLSSMSDPGALELAKLIYHIAVSMQSMWGAAETGVMFSTNGNNYVLGDYPQLGALHNNFPLAASAQWAIRTDYTDSEWHDLLQNELVNDRVVYYRGEGSAGHSWVIDGVDDNDLYHMNFGWTGDYNGYYALSAINPGGENFNSVQMAMVGLKANDGSTIVDNTTWSTDMTVDNIVVADDNTLTINAGVTISFSEGSFVRAYGSIVSNGVDGNMVKFTPQNQSQGWGGIKFHEDYLGRMADNDSSFFNYTQIEYSQNTGLYAYDYGKIVLDGCKINNNNNLIFDGGGIFVYHNPINIFNTQIYENNCIQSGGGLVFFVSSGNNLSAKIQNCDFFDNTADLVGGGVRISIPDNLDLLIENCTFDGNYAVSGAGMYIGGGSPEIVNCEFLNNEATSAGGGIYIENSDPYIIGSLFANCTALGGGALIIKNSN